MRILTEKTSFQNTIDATNGNLRLVSILNWIFHTERFSDLYTSNASNFIEIILYLLGFKL